MQAFRRSAATAAQTARAVSRQQTKRYAHHEAPAAGSIKYPEEEKLGTGFFLALSIVPVGFLLYKFTGPGNYEHKYLTRVINSYDGYRKDAAHIAALHTDALEQAAADRNLFANSQRQQNVQLKFPEILNTGAPHNVPAGHYADMSQVIAKFEKESYEANAKKLQQIKDNAVPSEHPFKGDLPTGAQTVLM
ncbi:hypothetical protein E4T47_06157 [Aureobasidium subglaciale]|nr:hypothetical protein E4T43_06110 [Aureobasidium subglaciale]KAI5270501.1 hypothetical protein E4T47_06157 [Aureobasidium subglaciale]